MRIVVTGGTGLIGRHLIPRLIEQGHQVVLFTRTPERARSLFQGKVTAIMWPEDSSHGGWRPALRHADGIIHLAGESIAKRWTTKHKQRILESRVQSTRALVQAVKEHARSAKLFISASAVGYYGPTDDWVDETASPGQDFLADVVQRWEAEALAAESTDMRVVFLRTGLFLSPDGGVLQRMLLPFKLFVGGSLGSGKQWLPWIHRDDWIRLLLHCLEDERAKGPINAVAPSPVKMADFATTLGKVIRRPSLIRVPSFALKLALGEMSSLVLTGQKVRPHQAMALQFQYQYEEVESALHDLLNE